MTAIHQAVPPVMAPPEPPLLVAAGEVPNETETHRFWVMDWYQMVRLLGRLHELQGYETYLAGPVHSDGEVDLVACRGAEELPILCTPWKRWIAGVEHVGTFHAAIQARGWERGILALFCRYTWQARTYADEHGITLLNETMIERLTEEEKARQDSVLQELLRDTSRHCPRCGATMRLTASVRCGEPGPPFWRCSSHPRCWVKLPAR